MSDIIEAKTPILNSKKSLVVAVGFKLPKEDAEKLKKILGEMGLSKSNFFRACVAKFLGEDQEAFLRELGFTKKFYWSNP